MSKRILGIDFGAARTGLAISDSLGLMAHGLGTVNTKCFKNLISVISGKIKEYSENNDEIDLIVIGDPINVNGTAGPESETVHILAERIRTELGICVELHDERYTTISAHKILNVSGTYGEKRKSVIDTLSAEIILQNYINKNSDRKSLT